MQVKKSFDKESVIKMVKGALIAGGGVAIVYLLGALMTFDFGPYTPLAVGVFSVLINNVKEWMKGG